MSSRTSARHARAHALDDQSCARQERNLAFARRAGHHIVGEFKETASGAKNDRLERKMVMALPQARKINAILVTELSRFGSKDAGSRADARRPQSWKVSVLAQPGLSFALSIQLMRTIMAELAEFERDLTLSPAASGAQLGRRQAYRRVSTCGFSPTTKLQARTSAGEPRRA